MKRAARLAAVERELQESSPPPDRRNVLTSEAETLRSLRASEAREAAVDTGSAAEEKAARDEIATAFIRQWKINRALYQDYGGRVIFQQGGLEPLDATRKFLEAAQARGDFAIVDCSLAASFWQYYLDDARHIFLPPGKATSRAMETPPWAGR